MSNYVNYNTLAERMTTERLNALCKVSGNALTALVNSVIDRAEAMINSYAKKRYQIPLPANKIVEEWTMCIAEYELYKRGPGTNVPEKIIESYKECLARLKDLAEGRLCLIDAPYRSDGKPMKLYQGDLFFDAEHMHGY